MAYRIEPAIRLLVKGDKNVSGMGSKVTIIFVRRYRGFMKLLLDLFAVGKCIFEV